VDIRFQAGGPAAWKADIALLFVCREDAPAEDRPELAQAAPWFTIAPGLRDFRGEKEERLLLHGLPDLPLPRLLITGLGPREACTLDIFRLAVAGAVRRCKELGLASILLPAPDLERLPGGCPRLMEEAIFAACISLYDSKKWQQRKEGEKADPEWLALGFAEEFVPDDARAVARRGEHSACGVALARDLVNTPPNLLGPAALAGRAEERAGRHKMRCEILDKTQLESQGMGGLLAVGAGSANAPCLVVLEYCPQGCEGQKPLTLVGKGLCFDSGGLSLKPAQNMHHMKGDMGGAAAILGALEAIALDAIPRRTAAVLACAENMPGGNAARPGDVVSTLAGLNVEILNTDAEGRMALCDALCYAQRRFAPETLVDVATLTGACAVALGSQMAGLFCTDAALSEHLRVLGAAVSDYLWPMPLWEPYKELLKSEVADLANIGPREGGAINAAVFLKQFVDNGVRWAHIDMAGTDRIEKGNALAPAGGSGYGVRLLVELARTTQSPSFGALSAV
jgi:leucyl aminopeptidase